MWIIRLFDDEKDYITDGISLKISVRIDNKNDEFIYGLQWDYFNVKWW